MLPDTSQTPSRPDAAFLLGELSTAADIIEWIRAPELRDFELRDFERVAGYYEMEEPASASALERAQLPKALPGGRPGWARLFRRMLDAEAPPTEVEIKQGLPLEAFDILAAIEANKMLRGIGELWGVRQEAVNLFPEALREGRNACPPYVPPSP